MYANMILGGGGGGGGTSRGLFNINSMYFVYKMSTIGGRVPNTTVGVIRSLATSSRCSAGTQGVLQGGQGCVCPGEGGHS